MMKTPLVVAAVLFGAVCLTNAQDAVFVAPAQEERQIEQREVIRRAPGLQGIIAQILRVANPLQLINPLAPSYYGTGEQNVSSDKDFSASYYDSTELTVFGVDW